jgi:hypothetical protein
MIVRKLTVLDKKLSTQDHIYQFHPHSHSLCHEKHGPSKLNYYNFSDESPVENGLYVLYQTGRVWTSRPAKKSVRSVRRKKNSNADVMYICVSSMSCSVVVLFTCTLVRSHPDSDEGVKCETRSVGTNSKILNEAWQHEIHVE